MSDPFDFAWDWNDDDGYALAFQVEDDGTVTGWTMIGDGSEVWAFTAEHDDEGFAAVQEFFENRAPASPEET